MTTNVISMHFKGTAIEVLRRYTPTLYKMCLFTQFQEKVRNKHSTYVEVMAISYIDKNKPTKQTTDYVDKYNHNLHRELHQAALEWVGTVIGLLNNAISKTPVPTLDGTYHFAEFCGEKIPSELQALLLHAPLYIGLLPYIERVTYKDKNWVYSTVNKHFDNVPDEYKKD